MANSRLLFHAARQAGVKIGAGALNAFTLVWLALLSAVETSKNFVLHGVWRVLCGGLDRHIEHHLYPNLPPNRLHALSPEIRELCGAERVAYSEYSSFWASLWDSVSYLGALSMPPRKSTIAFAKGAKS